MARGARSARKRKTRYVDGSRTRVTSSSSTAPESRHADRAHDDRDGWRLSVFFRGAVLAGPRSDAPASDGVAIAWQDAARARLFRAGLLVRRQRKRGVRLDRDYTRGDRARQPARRNGNARPRDGACARPRANHRQGSQTQRGRLSPEVVVRLDGAARAPRPGALGGEDCRRSRGSRRRLVRRRVSRDAAGPAPAVRGDRHDALRDAESAYRLILECLPPAERAELAKLLLDTAPVTGNTRAGSTAGAIGERIRK
jgi:hypothetical protein